MPVPFKKSPNLRISAKERGLIKGAIRRVFSRSDLRRKIVEASRVQYVDVSRPRVKKWSFCNLCSKATPTYQMEVDHKLPIIPVDDTLENMSWDTVIDNIWCVEEGLSAICESCHKIKTKAENAERRRIKKERKK